MVSVVFLWVNVPWWGVVWVNVHFFWSVCCVVSVVRCCGIGSGGVRHAGRGMVLGLHRHLVVVVFLGRGGGVGGVGLVWGTLWCW